MDIYYILYFLYIQFNNKKTIKYNKYCKYSKMGKKTKSKQRLDQYYHFAKTQGYRSRAAYKLIQLNRKYNFLNSATAVIDLCAAPGGWMQVCANTMPTNSTIIGVDLDQIKRVPGTLSFKGDITKQQTYQRLRKQLKGKKCDAVLNDGAPNVGANWSKDAYTQNQLVLAAFKLATDFLKPGGYFVTKIFRSTDTNSLMWVFKKFFQKVQMTKPKASRFTSAQTFVVGINFIAPNFIDQRYFDPKYIFKNTQADHFQQQMAGEITSIDKLLQNRRKRGGYQDNAPMHLYKEIALTEFINAVNPLLIFAQYNRITVTKQQRDKYYGLSHKIPQDVDQLLADLKVLGKREIGGLLKWRGKIREIFHKEKMKAGKSLKKQQDEQNQNEQQQQQELQMQEYQQQQEQEPESKTKKIKKNIKQQKNQQQNSQDELQREMLQKRRKQLKQLKQKQQKRSELLIKAQAANQQLNDDQQFGQQRFGNIIGDQDIQNIQYVQPQQQQDKKQKKPKYADYDAKQMQDNLQAMYEMRQQRKEQKMQHAREIRERKKQRRQERAVNTQNKLKSRRFGPDDRQQQQQQQQQGQQPKNQRESHQFEDFKFKNPLAAMDDQDIYISQNQQQQNNYEQQKIDPNERMQGQLSDDDAYVIQKPLTDMQRRRKQIKKNEEKKKKKLHKDIQDGQDVGGQIEIVKHKTMQDYNIDSLAETLVIAKKMLRNHSREQIIDESYRGFTFQDHDQLPKWFTDDEKKHNFKKLPITKEQFKQEKQRLMAINARVPKKILQAKVRRKIRIQKKLRKTQKKADHIMSQQGITEINKLRQVGKLYDKSKRELKDTKKYVVGKKNKSIGGKDSRKVKHVDSRLKKDKRAQKRISKTRHVKRHNKRRGRF